MGFCVSCLSELLSLPYTQWNYIRINVITAFVKFTSKKIGKRHPSLTEELSQMNLTSNDLFVSFIEIYNKYSAHFDHLGMNGIYLLIHKNDNEGSYNPEESSIILDSLQKISDYYTSPEVDDLRKVFQKSKDCSQIVLIE
jgi:hypothetical protein